MLRSYILTSLRYLLRNRSYAILNTLGLSVGLACFTLIGLWVYGELSYDRFHTMADRIYKVNGIFKSESENLRQGATPTPLRHALKRDMPEVEDAVIIDNNDAIVRRGDVEFMEDYLLMTDPSFLNIFSFEMLAGDKSTALNDPYSVILSESMARKYFGDENPVGKDLIIYLQDPEGKGKAYNVTGIIEDCPENSHFRYQALISFATFDVNNPGDPHGHNWFNNGYFTYILLHEGSDPDELEAKFPSFIEKYMGKQSREWKISYEYFLQKMTDIHLRSDVKYEIQPASSIDNVIIFATVGVIVLLLACINYINLATAFSTGRFKEAGMRKLMGAFRGQLMGRYLTESLILAYTSLLLSIAWIELSRPVFESITGKSILSLYTIETLALLTGISTAVGLLAGFYPAVLLTSFKPVNTVKGQLRSGTTGVMLRKSLVVLQYTITILLVVGIIVVNRQLDFMQRQDLGFNQNGLLMMGVNGSREVMENYEAFANELRSLPFVGGVARSNTSLAGGLGNSVGEMEGADGNITNATIYRVRTDYDYLDTYQMTLLAGRFFVEENGSDSTTAFVVNESFARSYGFDSPDVIVGKTFRFQGREGQIIGVVKDFHYNSLQFGIDPTCLYLLRGGFSQVAVRLTQNIFENKRAVERIWKKHFPKTIVDDRFAEESVNAQYEAEQKFSSLFGVFSVLSLAIACLGLFALVSFSVESRTKEIGIRKALGATVPTILSMFSREFIALVVIAAIVALPVGYYLTENWLQGFAYHIDLDLSVFLLAGGLVLLIAWLTITARSLQAATANPVDSLRQE